MKKWFVKNKDTILTNFIAGILVLLVIQLFVFITGKFFNFFNSHQNSVSNFLYKVSKIYISIPLYAIVLFILLTILTSKFYNIIKIRNKKLKIISATYFTDLHSIDITNELNNAIEDSKLKIVLSNNIAGDPHKGEIKKGKIKYKFNKQESEKEYQEGNLIELP
jgi:hypothetical protein